MGDIIDDLFKNVDASRIQTPKIGGFSVKTINILGSDSCECWEGRNEDEIQKS